ncbi:MAG TPA: hypothetical protein VGM56_04690 [Byssovorax sp.]|jgi:hypothetical protein
MRLRLRSFALAALPVLYVAAVSVQQTGGSALAFAMLGGLPLALLFAWSRTAPPVRGVDRTDGVARTGARVAFTGAALVCAARTGTGGAGFLAAENLGAALAATGGLVAFSRVQGPGGLVDASPRPRRLDAAAFGSLLWAVAIALPAAQIAAPDRAQGLDPRWLDYGVVAASLASLGVMLASTALVLVQKRLELGAADRAGAAFSLALTALLVGVLAAVTGVAPAERLLPLACACAGVALAASAVAREADALAQANRVTLAAAALVAPLALFAGYVARVAPKRSAATVAVAVAAASLAGMIAPILGRRLFAPAAGRWLSALDAATRAAMTPDPEAALEAALLALRAAAGQRGKDPALYFVGVPEVVTVDRAGYARRERAEPPPRLVELAAEEPEGVLRLEVLRAVLVRRPDVRPLEAWLDQRGFSALALVRDDAGPIGLLAIPAGSRRRAWTLEEARALRRLADRLGAVIGASALLARSRARELEVRGELANARTQITEHAAARARDATRHRAAAEALARRARLASYSPAARAAREAIERLAERGRPIALLSAPGIDASTWAAAAHLASARRDGPLVVVAGTRVAEHGLDRWRDPAASPLAAAETGTLVLLDAQALPLDVQRYVAASLGDSTGLVVSLRATVDALVAADALGEELADRLGDRAVALPPLAARAEDLRALTLEILAELSITLGARAVGLDAMALAVLLEHEFPGNDAELAAVLVRAALAARGDAITRADLERAGFTAAAELSPHPRRASSRPPRAR